MAAEYLVQLLISDPLERGMEALEEVVGGFDQYLEEADYYSVYTEVEQR